MAQISATIFTGYDTDIMMEIDKAERIYMDFSKRA
jgi:hypothetical protein